MEIDSVPSNNVHGVTAVVIPVRVQVLLPVLRYRPKPLYCAAGPGIMLPICPTSKLLSVLPPSASVEGALAFTRPVIVGPARNSRRLVPVKRMATVPTDPLPLVIVPLLTMLVLLAVIGRRCPLQ